VSQVTYQTVDGQTIALGVDYDVDDATGNLHLLNKVRTEHTSRDIGQVASGHWVMVSVNGLETS